MDIIDERYKNGKIYKIVCNETNEVYYGSTRQKYLSNRIKTHRGENCISKQIIDRKNYYYELVEDYSCNNRYELETRERWYILNNDCINKNIPTRTKKQWNEDNKETIIEKRKETITCNLCGYILSKRHLKRHQQRQICIKNRIE